MPLELKECRLLGGPYDGDQGSMTVPLPDRIWAYPCPHGGGRDCNHGGIHWTTMQEKVEEGDDVECYHHDHVKPSGEHVYRWADLELEPLATEEEEQLLGMGV